MTSGIDESCSITNSSGKSLVVLDAYSLGTDVATNAPQQAYQQSLKMLPFSEGGYVLENGQTDSVTLNDTYTNSLGQQAPSYVYNLLLSEPQSLFPVMSAGESLNFSSTPMGYPPIEATEAAANNMTLALSFWQNIMAYPSSNLATGFVNAMNQAQQQSSPAAMDQVIADYFNSTAGYKGLDLPSYVAVTTYLQTFAWVWGLDDNNTPGRTYWVYSSAGAGQQPSGEGNEAPNLGSIVFALKSDAPNPADPNDTNSGYNISFFPSDSAPQMLTFNKGQLVNDVSADIPAICLQGTYALKSQFTGSSSDNVLWPILVGSVNGTQVIVVSQSPATWWQKNISSKTFGDWVNLFLKVMGLWMAFDFLKTKLMGKKNKLEDEKTNENKGQDPSEQQIQEADQSAEAVGQNSLDEEREIADRLDSDEIEVPDEDDIDAQISEVQDGQVEVANEMEGDYYQQMIDNYNEQIEQLAEIEVNPQIEEAMSDLVAASESMPAARESGDYSEVQASLTEVNDSINAAMESMPISEEVRQSIEESQAEIEEYEEAADNLDGVADDVKNGEDPVEPEIIE